MKRLQDRAITFIRTDRWMPCHLFYRDKNPEYYDHCRQIGFLPPTLKNENGDPASPINCCIEGTFMGVNVDLKTGELPEYSPYGKRRFHIPIECLYGPDFNLYFADFYCHKGSKSHHVTLVLTRADTSTDIFCKFRLLKLDRMNNPFLYQDPNSGWMWHSLTAWIHIFYTEMIPINRGWLSWVERCMPSTNTEMGKPKDASCKDCNI